MNRQITILTLFLFGFFTVCGQTSNEYWTNLPNPTGWVNDFEDIFTIEQERILDSVIAEYEKKKSIEISVITLPSSASDKERFDELTLFIANKWGIGKKEKNNGILIAISKGHRTIRIQNGIGIQKVISDKQTKEIIDQEFLPNFKNGDFYKGTFLGINKIIELIDEKTRPRYVNLEEINLFELIELLKMDTTDKISSNILVVDSNIPEKWFTKANIDSLFKLINSVEPAKCIIKSHLSFFPIDIQATVGGQISDIIEAYKEMKAYPIYEINCSLSNTERIRTFEKWWYEQKR